MRRIILIAFLCLACNKAAPGTKQESKGSGSNTASGSAATDDFSTAAAPIPVTAANLHVECNWDRLGEADTVKVACSVSTPVPPGTKFLWSALGEAASVSADGATVEFVVARGMLASFAARVVLVRDDGTPQAPVDTPFASALPALEPGGTLATCLASPEPIASCFAASAVGIQTGGEIGRGCRVTARPAIVRRGHPDTVVLSLEEIGPRSDAELSFATATFPPGTTATSASTEIAFIPTTTVADTPGTKLRFAAQYRQGVDVFDCHVDVSIETPRMIQTNQTLLTTATAPGERSSIEARYDIRNLYEGETLSLVTPQVISEDIGDFTFKFDAPPVCDAGLCKQELILGYSVQFLVSTTVYRGQVYRLEFSGPKGADGVAKRFNVSVARDIVIQINGDANPAASYDGTAGAP